MQVDTMREQLETQLDEAKQEQEQLEARLEDKPSFGLGEGATLAYSWEMQLARRETLAARIKSLQEALARIEQNQYGLCERCGTAIDPERLEILPETTFCTACAT